MALLGLTSTFNPCVSPAKASRRRLPVRAATNMLPFLLFHRCVHRKEEKTTMDWTNVLKVIENTITGVGLQPVFGVQQINAAAQRA